MLIMSLHQGICNWSTSAAKAWKDGSYCTAFLYSIIARITSAAGLIFQICYSPLQMASAVQNARQAFKAHKLRSAGYAFLISLKTALLAVTILIYGIAQSILSLFIPEIVYSTLKAQKPLYAQYIISHIDSHIGLDNNLLETIRQHICLTGLQFDAIQFQGDFKATWLRNALSSNRLKLFGNSDPHTTVQESLEAAISEYPIRQLELLEQTDIEQYHSVLQRISQLPTRQQDTQLQTLANRAKSKCSQETALFGKILFSHMKAASTDLCKRKCFSADDLETQMGGAYYAVIGLAIFNITSAAKINSIRGTDSIELEGGSHHLTLDTKVNLFSLRQSFIELKKLITQLENGRQEPEKKFFEECYKLLIARLSFPEKKEDNESIERKQKILEADRPQIAELATNIFKLIGTMTGVLSQRVLTSNSGINWPASFKPSA